jgi:hypothetical protein
MNSSLLSLPDEILILIAEFTPVGDLRHLRLVRPITLNVIQSLSPFLLSVAR